MILGYVDSILTGSSPYNAELRTFGQAFMGAVAVRSSNNKNKQMNWFHAFALTTIVAFGGGWFAFLWMGKPTSLITNGDVTLTLTAASFVIATYTPYDIGLKVGTSLPIKIVMNSWAQLFRSLGMIFFINTCAAEVGPSKYYPTPILGPVVYGTLLGNMGSFFLKGFHGHLENGIPWPFQNGIVMGLFYNIYTHDVNGMMGKTLRSIVQSTGIQGDMDDKHFATLVVSIFMQITGILMLFYGPKYNIFFLPSRIFNTLLVKTTSTSSIDKAMAKADDSSGTNTLNASQTMEVKNSSKNGKKKRKKKKKVA